MSTQSKSFSLSHVLTITTDRLLCGGMGGIYEILNHITGDDLFTHVLPRAGRFATPLLLERFPELAAANTEQNLALLDHYISLAKATDAPLEAACTQWVYDMPTRHGMQANYDVPCWSDRWLSLDPLKEAEALVGKANVLQVDPNDPASVERLAESLTATPCGTLEGEAK